MFQSYGGTLDQQVDTNTGSIMDPSQREWKCGSKGGGVAVSSGSRCRFVLMVVAVLVLARALAVVVMMVRAVVD